MAARQGEQHKRYICSFPECEAAYNKQWKLDAHMCKHTGVKPYKCEMVNGCSKTFCTQYHLARHQLSHSGERPFQCTHDGCEDSFTTNSNLQRHIGRSHGSSSNNNNNDSSDDREQKTYACNFTGCGLVFRKHKQLKSHKCEQHTQEPPYQCTFEGCQMRFTFPNKLKRHEKVHRGYPCAEQGCSFQGKTWSEYQKHKKDLHRDFLQCDQCDKVFRDSWFLQQHQRIHSEVRQVLKCPRDGCERSFTTSFNLQSHISSFHEELRVFACSHEGCEKTFAMKQSLQRHSVVHDPERKKLRKPRPKKSLASRLSGYKPPKKKAVGSKSKKSSSRPVPDPVAHVSKCASEQSEKTGPPGAVELVSLLHDTSLLYSPVLETNVSNGLTAVVPV